MEKAKERRMNFHDLDLMANNLICELPSWVDTFLCQAKGEQEYTDASRLALLKVDELLSRLRVLEVVSDHVDCLLTSSEQNNDVLESIVSKLEQEIKTQSQVDINDERSNFLRQMEEVHCALNRSQDLMAESRDKLSVYENISLKEPLVKIVQIMINQLENLERIEMKTYRLEDELMHVENSKRRVMDKLKADYTPEKVFYAKCSCRKNSKSL